MKKDDLYNGVTDVSDGSVSGARRRRRKIFTAAVAAILALSLGIGGILVWRGRVLTPGTLHTRLALAQAQYPRREEYPREGVFGYDEDRYDRWWEESRARQLTQEELASAQGAWDKLLPAILGAAGEGDAACSPANVYMALSMLAEIAAGDSQKQILDLLGTDSAEAQRALAKRLWNALYNDDGTYSCLLANSLWLRDDTDYEKAALRTLAEDYYASSFAGKMGSGSFNSLLRKWMNKQTGGLLEDQIGDISLSPETALALVSTALFTDKWEMEFLPERTDRMTFHGEDGDYERDFMHSTYPGTYYWSERFAGVELAFESGGTMRFLLPDEGVSVAEVLRDPMAVAFLTESALWDTFEGSCRSMHIVLSLPKFDVTSDLKLIEALKSLGVSDVFDPERADFSPILRDSQLLGDPLYVSQVLHGARVRVDEEGCEAAAYTLITLDGAADPGGEEVKFVEIVFDRPFLYSLMSGGVPLFAGCVRQ